MHKKQKSNASSYWLFGNHCVQEAINNPKRTVHRVISTRPIGFENAPSLKVETKDRQTLDNMFPDQVHQGIAALVDPLPETFLEDLIQEADQNGNAFVIVLDQVTDPHNIGAILRSVTAFGAQAIILTEKHSPNETGIIAKSACGAMELTPIVRVVNLARAIRELKENGFWCIGFGERAKQNLSTVPKDGKLALILGNEGTGLRRLTMEECDYVVKIPTVPHFPSLNVSNAAAIALYELKRDN